MGIEDGYKIRNKDGIYFITFAVIKWINVFNNDKYCEIVIDSLKYCQKEKGLILYSWCLMSNHIHLVISAKDHNPSDLLRDFKKFTSKKIIEGIVNNPNGIYKDTMLSAFEKAGAANKRNKTYQFWQQNNQPIELFSQKFIHQKVNYIHNNPVKAGIVNKPEDYLYSSAINYLSEKGLIEVVRLF